MKSLFNYRWLAAVLLLSMTGMLFSCGDDKDDDPVPDPDPIENPTPDDNPSTNPDDGQQPGDEENPTPDEPDDPGKYFNPTEEQFVGTYKVVKEIKQTYRYLNGKWSLRETSVTEGEDLNRYEDIYPYRVAYVTFTNQYNNPENFQFWGEATNCLEQIQETIKNGKSDNFWNLYITDGQPQKTNIWELSYNGTGDKERVMLMLKRNGKVQTRWEILKFDGDNFVMERYFKDRPQGADEGAESYEMTYYYTRTR